MPPLPGCKPCFKSPAGPFIFFLIPLDQCFVSFFRLRFVCMCMSVFCFCFYLHSCMYVYTWCVPMDSCEPQSGAGNQTQAFCKNSKCSQPFRHLSSPLFCFLTRNFSFFVQSPEPVRWPYTSVPASKARHSSKLFMCVFKGYTHIYRKGKIQIIPICLLSDFV